MKLRYFCLIPLLLVSCTNNFNNATGKNETLVESYVNVHYYYSYDNDNYVVVYDEDKESVNVDVKNVYTIYVDEYRLVDQSKSKYYDDNIVYDELFIYKTTNKLYIYKKWFVDALYGVD